MTDNPWSAQSPAAATPAADWYPDPQQPGRLRYWDGAAWTGHVTEPTMANDFPPPPTAGRNKLSTGAIVGIVVGSVVLVFIVLPVIAAVAIPIFLSQRGQASDSAAKADVSTLGKEIATHFVDSSQLPTVRSGEGSYVFEGSTGSFEITRSAGVEFGGLEGTSNTDWCVWVTNPEGNDMDYQYSAQGGLEVGRC